MVCADFSIESANNAYRDWCIKNGKEYSPYIITEYHMSVAGATVERFSRYRISFSISKQDNPLNRLIIQTGRTPYSPQLPL